MSRTLTQKKRPAVLATSVAALLGLGLLLGTPRAVADEYWDGSNPGTNTANGSGGNGVWDTTTANWSDQSGSAASDHAYVSTDLAIFSTTGGTVALGESITFTSLRFDANNYIIDPGAGPFTLTTSGAGLIFISSLNAVTNGVTINAQITGANVLSLQGDAAAGTPGTITLTNSNNNYSGGTIIGNAGIGPTVVINNDGDLGQNAGILTFDGGKLQTTADVTSGRGITLSAGSGTFLPDGGTTLELDGKIDGSGSLSMNGAGNLKLVNTGNSYTGGTTINASVLVISADGNLGGPAGPITFSGGALENTASITTSRSVTLNAPGGIFLPDAGKTLELDSAITGTGPLTMNGAGILVLASTGNAYTGSTTIGNGTLRAGAVNVIPGASPVLVSTGATFDLSGFSQNVTSIEGAGTITLGAGTLTTGSGNTTKTFSGPISGTGGLTKVGTATLTLSGANTYTGATTVNGGFLVIDPTTNSPVLSSSSALAVGGGQFQLNGVPATNTIQILNGLTVNAGSSVVAVNNLGTTTTLDLRGSSGTMGIIRNANGFVDFKAITGTLGVNAIIKTNQANDASGIIGTWATVNGGSSFATNNGSGVIVAYTGFTDINALGPNQIQDNPNSNVRINGMGTSGPVLIAKPLTRINSLTQNFTTASVIDTSPGTLRLGPTGGIFIAPGKAALTIGTAPNSGTLSAGEDTMTVASEMTLENNSGSLLTINSVIADNASTAKSAPVSVRVDGSGTTVFAGNNTYTGSTTIFNGTLQMAAPNSIPSNSAVAVDTNGTLKLNNFSQSVGSIANGPTGGGAINLGSGTLTTGNDNTDTTYSGLITGTGMLVKVGTGTLTITNPANSYSGGTTLNSGRLNANGDPATGLGSPLGTGTLTINGGTLGSTLEESAPPNPSAPTGTLLTNLVSVKGDFSIAPNVDANNPGRQNITLKGPVDLNGGTNGATRTITGIVTGGQVHFGGGINNGSLTLTTTFTNTGDYVAFIMDAGNVNTYTGLTSVKNGAFLVFEGNTADAGVKGDLNIEAGGVVDYLQGNPAQIADTSTVTVNSGGNFAGGIFFGGLDLFTSTGDTIGTLNGSINGVVSLGAANLSIGAGTFAGTIFDGQHTGFSGGQITKFGPGTLFLSGQNFYTGGTTIDAGILQINSDQSLGAAAGPLTFNGGTLEVVPDSVAVGNRPVILNAAAAMQIDGNAAAEFDGVISGTGPLTKTGPGDLFLGGTNTFTGGTVINRGNLFLTGTGTLVSPVTVNSTGTFVLENGATLTATPVKVNSNGTFDNQGTFTSAAKAVVVNDPTGVGTVVNSGTLSGTAAAIDASTGGGVKIVNFGTITGPILLGPGANTIVLATQLRPVSPTPVIPGGPGNNDTLELAGSAQDSFNVSAATNFEFLHKVGGGLWTITGAGNFPRGTTISGGAIAVQGNLLSNVIIEPAGTLAGTGLVTGNVFNGGMVMPGVPSTPLIPTITPGTLFPTITPGTLLLKGNYNQSPTGALVIQVNGTGTGQYSQLSIGGHAQLNGTLIVQNGSGQGLKFGQKLTFLTASGGVNGTFSNVVDAFAGDTIVVGKVVYESNDVVLEGAQGSFKSVDVLFHLTPNQKAVAAAVDNAASDPRAAKLLTYLDNRDLKKLPGDFNLIAPEEMASVFRIGVSLSDVQARNVQRRTADLREGVSGFSAAGFQTTGGPNYSGGLAGANGSEGANGKTASAPTDDRRWGGFITGVGDFAHVGESANASSYDLNTGGVTVGADYKLNDHLAVGVTAGYAATNANLAESGRLLVNGGKVGAYGTYYTGGFHADAAVSGGYNSYSTRRSSIQGDAYGSTEGGEFDALAAAGYDWRLDALTIGPTASFQYTYVGIDGFTERDSLSPLRYAGQHQSSMRSTFGLRMAYDWKVGGVIVRPEGELAWQHEYGDRSYSIDSAFASGAGSMFSVTDTPLGRDSFLFGGGVSVLWNTRTSTYLYYDADLLKKEYYSQSVTGGLRMNF